MEELHSTGEMDGPGERVLFRTLREALVVSASLLRVRCCISLKVPSACVAMRVHVGLLSRSVAIATLAIYPHFPVLRWRFLVPNLRVLHVGK